MMNPDFDVVFSGGTGRPFVIIFEAHSEYAVYADAVGRKLSETTKVVLIKTAKLTDENWKKLSTNFLEFIKGQNIRQASYVSFGAASTLIYNIYLREPKIVRTAVIVDSACRAHPTLFSRLIDFLETKFPLGLPLRSGSKRFDVRAHLQRIRCPVLVLTSPKAPQFLVEEAHEANRMMPSSWFMQLASDDSVTELCSMVEQFQEVPAKCPQ